MIFSLKWFGPAVLLLGLAAGAANAAGLTIAGRTLGLATGDAPAIDLAGRSVSIEIPDEPGIALRYQSDERPIGISERQDQPHLQTRMFEPQAVLRCKLDAEAAGSLIVANVGSDAVMAGTTIRWQVRGSGDRGLFSLSRDLRPGQSVRARDVFPGDAEGGGKCSAKAV